MKELKLAKETPPNQMPQCIICKWYGGMKQDTGPICIAFPSSIPDEIWNNDFDHTKGYLNVETSVWDHDITFEEIRR